MFPWGGTRREALESLGTVSQLMRRLAVPSRRPAPVGQVSAVVVLDAELPGADGSVADERFRRNQSCGGKSCGGESCGGESCGGESCGGKSCAGKSCGGESCAGKSCGGESCSGEPCEEGMASGAPEKGSGTPWLESQQSDQEAVLVALLQGASRHLPFVLVLHVDGEVLGGLLSLAHEQLERDHGRAIRVQLPVESTLRNVVEQGAVYTGPPPAELEPLLCGAGEAMPREVMALPVVVREQAVALLIGHCGARPLPDHLRVPMARLVVEAGATLAAQQSAEPAAEEPEQTAVVSAAELGPEAVDEVLRALVAGGEQAEDARERLRGSSLATVRVLVDRFLIALHEESRAESQAESQAGNQAENQTENQTEPRDAATNAPSECRRVLSALAIIGGPALPELVRLLQGADARQRRYVTEALGELEHVQALLLLARMTRDEARAVRHAAFRLLFSLKQAEHYPPLWQTLLELAKGTDPRRQREAIMALGVLGDERAVEPLIELLDHGDRALVDLCARSLVALTNQPYTQRQAVWLAWWWTNQLRSRVEWLIDGVAHASWVLRAAALAELEALMGERLELRADASKKERERVRQHCMEWWTFHEWWRDSQVDEPLGELPRGGEHQTL